jgi:acyl-CoA synthetase (AMP-forming)/AMP-acid ligase II
MAIGSMYFEVTTTILSPRLFLQRPVEWLRALSEHGGTISFAPNFAYGLCARRAKDSDLEGLDLSRWRIAGCGAEPIQEETLRAFARRFAPLGFSAAAFLPCYGMAEHTLAISFPRPGTGLTVDTVHGGLLRGRGRAVACPPADPDALRVVSCGQAFPGHAIRIVDDLGAPLPDRAVGEIVVSGPSVMQGYESAPAVTRAALRDGWLHTGDLGYLSGGELFVCGRKKDVIVVNGKKYHPQDIEWAAGDVSGVRRGNVVAFGEGAFHAGRERVVIVAESTGAVPAEDLERRIRGRVAEATGLTVERIVVAPPGTLPKTTSGKLQRSRTREAWKSGTLLAPRRSNSLLRHLLASQLAYWRRELFGPR